VLALLDRLTRQAGKNLILVTHSREAAGYADRILTLHDGHLISDHQVENRESPESSLHRET
jgi:putative ABC transport system ATP-binding protein